MRSCPQSYKKNLNLQYFQEYMHKKKQLRHRNCFLLWCHQESNRGHKDFQSFALPTELWHLAFICFASAKVGFFSYTDKLSGNFFTF